MIRPLYIFLFFIHFSLFSIGQITFSPHIEIPTSDLMNHVVTDDFNNDGLIDLVVANVFNGNSSLLWMYKQQNGQFIFIDTINYTLVRTNTSAHIDMISSGDLNHDGLKDIVVEYGDTIKIFFQDSVSHFFKESNFITFVPDSTLYTYGIACDDLNNDGLCDMAITTWGGSLLYIYYQNPNHSFTLDTLFKRTTSVNTVLISDINNDGLNDIIVSQRGGYGSHDNEPFINCFAIYIRDSSNSSFQFPIFYAIDTITGNSWIYNDVTGIAIGDIDNDGYLDIVTSYIDQSYIWHQVPGSSNFFPNPPDTLLTYENPSAVFIKDLNNDGKNEILINDESYDQVSVYESDSNYYYSNYFLVNIANYGSNSQDMISVSDLNNDSFPDIITGFSYGVSLVYNTTPLIGIDEIENKSHEKLIIYPNPSNNIFSINLKEEISNAQLKIYDLLGRIKLERQINSNTLILNNKELKEGNYIVLVTNKGRQYFGKLCIE